PAVSEYLDAATIRSIIDINSCIPLKVDSNPLVFWNDNNPAAVDLYDGAVLKISPCQNAVRGSRIESNYHSEFRGASLVLLDGERLSRTD
ncbi:MAG: hypothetical protein DMG20_11635, partial [Acidobacteria bacterium]